MNQEIRFNSIRTQKARFATRFNKNRFRVLYSVCLALIVFSIYSFTFSSIVRLGYLSLALATFAGMIAIWYYQDLRVLPPNSNPKSLDDVLSKNVLARLSDPVTPKKAWAACTKDWPAGFICHHLLLDPMVIYSGLSDNASDMKVVWDQVGIIVQHNNLKQIDGGTLITALITTSVIAQKYITENNLRVEDVLEVHGWLVRLQKYIDQPKPNFGGIGRDWASGFIPTLEKYSQNISNIVEFSGSYAHFLSNADVIGQIINNLNHGTAVALVGAPGTGKTSLIYGLAEKLLEGQDPKLKHYQIVSLNSSLILSSGANTLEGLMLTIFGEAIHAGNIIVYLDEAQLFFGSGVGAFNMSQLLLPVLQNQRIKIIAAFSPNSWQQFRASNESLSANFSTIIIPEPSAIDTMKVMEDRALQVEQKERITVSFEAIREAYRLSGQFIQELSYPGKAINLLEQSLPYVEKDVMTAKSVQNAIERTKGIKVAAASEPEADILLHLEDRIHERMVNQTRAVNLIAAALRRGRAGVANPNRPVGSFLFLGPTGVGKTELARSLAATYFGDEKNMIRLDMSEFQRPNDVSRLLSLCEVGDKSLLMSIREQPFSVVLLDEVEKSHDQILNLLLQILDEGQLTDQTGRPASFKKAIIICTSNAGSAEISARVSSGGALEGFERPLIDKLIAGEVFRPELINRFDEVVLFRPLNEEELAQIAGFMLQDINKTLANQNISVDLTPAAMQLIARRGFDPQFGARPMRRVMQKTVEDALATKILKGEARPGSKITLDAPEITVLLNR